MPKIYNAARLNERPIPPIDIVPADAERNHEEEAENSFVVENRERGALSTSPVEENFENNSQIEGNSNAIPENIASAAENHAEELVTEALVEEELENNAENETNSNAMSENVASSVENHTEGPSIEPPARNEEVSTTDAMKIEPFAEVLMNQDDLRVVENLFSENDVQQNDPLADSIGAQSTGNDEANSSDEFEIECTYNSLDDFRPKMFFAGYELKMNDTLCNNIPFRTNVSPIFIQF